MVIVFSYCIFWRTLEQIVWYRSRIYAKGKTETKQEYRFESNLYSKFTSIVNYSFQISALHGASSSMSFLNGACRTAA